MSTKIYFEAQDEEFQLCGQHSLNNLLQGAYFTAFDLGDIGAALDRQEQMLYNATTKFLQKTNRYSNVGMSGSFSLDVLLAALNQLNLRAISFSHPDCDTVQQHPEREEGFIVNHAGHWTSYRKVDSIWYNLNSIACYRFVEAQPIKISEIYLAAQLMRLYENGYQVYVIRGAIPPDSKHAPRMEDLKHEYKWYDAEDIATHSQLYKVSQQYEMQHMKALHDDGSFKKGFHIKWRVKSLPKRNTNRILEEQNHECVSCGAVLPSNFLNKTKYVYCEYTGTMHCTQCHKKEKAVIPFRVFNTLSCKRMSVCVAAKQFLDKMYLVPCVTMSMFAHNKKITKNKKIHRLKQILFELKEIKKYANDLDCKTLKEMMKESYIYDGMLSLHDVVNMLEGVTLLKLEIFSNKLQKHITDDCAVCPLKRRYCALCSSLDVLYPFKNDDVMQCNQCNTYYHAFCYNASECVKCKAVAS